MRTRKKETTYMHAVSIFKKTVTEREGLRVLDPEPQRPHLTFVVINAESHELIRKCLQ